ncbi:feruloyl esterase [Saccharospirillum sp. MSK14-1]|uniref:tannase/feruloyl esterase family alpha/beta hydrolase n=1 Tax=Saccharospirillum sp. MSK14-1 TaxID=1897632 RepID=UPI000D3D2A30|nr:tannase/feruloyl esterase family alpha/beta hydrolase [Saccharospirillum sp. MSK14-1]PTY37867.1 feruloyl esterase [Saccharospirillum sp. MSK14-1]
MKSRTKLMVILTTLGTGISSAALAEQLECSQQTTARLGVSDVQIDVVESIAAGGEVAVGHCRLAGITGAHRGMDGNDYAIGFELRLPDDWNGRFVHQFNGGNDGAVVSAVGPLLGGDDSDTALSRGYAVVSSNAGHRGDAHPDAGLAGGARFGFDAQARRDYGYQAVATLNPLAEAMVEAYYDAPIEYSYGVGGSNGGRHAMVAASRLPDAFDGLLAGYPGFNLPKAAIQHAWDVQAFKAVTGDVRTAFSRDDLDRVARNILAQCDNLDGLTDNWVADVDACQQKYNPDWLQCSPGQTQGCLSAAQVTALKTVHRGPHNSAGEALYSDWAWDSGIGSGDWRFWKLESPIPPWGNNSLIAVMGSSSLAQLFTTPPTRVAGSPQALEAYLLAFDFDRDAPLINNSTAQFPESAMDFMTPPGAENPELADFRDAGGKLIVFHGVSDPVFSVRDTTRWYQKLDANNGANAAAFARYYRVPGMPHGAGGPAPDDFDVFSVLVDWVEHGREPGAVTASVSDANEAGQAMLGDVSRLLCPYPQVARYGSGEPHRASSFSCR